MLRIFLVPQIKILRITDFFISKKQLCIKKLKRGVFTQFKLIIDYTIENIKPSAEVRMECVWRVVLSDREKRRLIHYRPQVYTLFY